MRPCWRVGQRLTLCLATVCSLAAHKGQQLLHLRPGQRGEGEERHVRQLAAHVLAHLVRVRVRLGLGKTYSFIGGMLVR